MAKVPGVAVVDDGGAGSGVDVALSGASAGYLSALVELCGPCGAALGVAVSPLVAGVGHYVCPLRGSLTLAPNAVLLLGVWD